MTEPGGAAAGSDGEPGDGDAEPAAVPADAEAPPGDVSPPVDVPGGPAPPSAASAGARRLARWLRTPAILFGISLVVFSLFAWNRLPGRSTDPHFVLLANAFLEGTVEIRKCDIPRDVPSPHGTGALRHDNDWASWEELPLKDGTVLRGNYVEGTEHEDPYRFETLDRRLITVRRDRIDPAGKRVRHYFVSFPPAPAILMMPLAVIRGYKVNDVAFTVFFAALNVALCYVLLRRMRGLGITERKAWENVTLALVLGFGTVNLWCSVLGQVWFTALVVALTGMLLYLTACLDTKRPILAGAALAFCVATRPQLGFAGVLFLGLLLFPEGRLRRSGWKEALTRLGLFAVPLVVVGVLLAWYNWVRFGNPMVFGHEFLQAGKLDRIVKWGLFNYHFLSINLTAAFTTLPKLSREVPYIQFSLHGMCIFLSTPVLVYLAAAKYAGGDRTAYLWHRVLWATALAVAVPGFLYQNTGWEQYGFRFSMDWIAFLVVLLALSRRRLTWIFLALAVLGFLVNAWGAISFKRGPPFDVFYDTWLVP